MSFKKSKTMESRRTQGRTRKNSANVRFNSATMLAFGSDEGGKSYLAKQGELEHAISQSSARRKAASHA